jgi:hypothetical protein
LLGKVLDGAWRIRQDRPVTRPDPRVGPAVEPIHQRAISDLGIIRDTMERAASFTALPGWWMSAMGACVLPVAFLASRLRADRPLAWLAIWLAAAALAVITGVAATRAKARRLGLPLVTAPYRRFVLLFGAPVVAGAVLTPVLFLAAGVTLLPGAWLLLYGVGLVSGGLLTVRPVAWTGGLFMVLGAVALAFHAGDLAMAVGFGGLHVGLGIVIGNRHGG